MGENQLNQARKPCHPGDRSLRRVHEGMSQQNGKHDGIFEFFANGRPALEQCVSIGEGEARKICRVDRCAYISVRAVDAARCPNATNDAAASDSTCCAASSAWHTGACDDCACCHATSCRGTARSSGASHAATAGATAGDYGSRFTPRQEH